MMYRFYATLLDSFQQYISSEEIYQQYFGMSENPAKSLDEFEQESFLSLINKINRAPLADSTAADRGTCFNEIVDCIIEHRKPRENITLVKNYKQAPDGDLDSITATMNGNSFTFPFDKCWEFAQYFKGATTQVYVEASLPTRHGDVRLYGFIDELMPSKVHDIKTTAKYHAGKYRNNWQHRVYPYCLHKNGAPIDEFEYNVAEITKSGKVSTFTEHYLFRADRDTALLQEHCERLIEFINANRHLITDTKIFGGE